MGPGNFTLNGLDPAAHDFIYGDAFDWLRRLAKKGRVFDAWPLDPPTFSQSKEHGLFRAEKDFWKLVAARVGRWSGRAGFVRRDERGGLAAEKFLADVKRRFTHAAENFTAASCPAAAGLPHQPAEPAFFENGMVENRAALTSRQQ